MGHYQTLMDVNVRAPVLFAKAAIPHLDQGGRIISIGSGLGERVPFPGVTAYAMSKAALVAFRRGLSRELGPKGITVNLVQPGSIATDANPAIPRGRIFSGACRRWGTSANRMRSQAPLSFWRVLRPA